MFDTPYYRLAFGDSDGLPGLVVDRYGDILVAQITTAGMEKLKAEIVAALQKVTRGHARVPVRANGKTCSMSTRSNFWGSSKGG